MNVDVFRLEFDVVGNQEKPEGNPIPYQRSTQRGSWNKQVTRYHYWRDHIKRAFLEAIIDTYLVSGGSINVGGVGTVACFDLPTGLRPIKVLLNPVDVDIRCNIVITARYAVDRKDGLKASNHADGDNILKGVIDALFMDDKAVRVGGFRTEYGEAGNVRVSILMKKERPRASHEELPA
jgi:hypothetical protein